MLGPQEAPEDRWINDARDLRNNHLLDDSGLLTGAGGTELRLFDKHGTQTLLTHFEIFAGVRLK